MAKSPRGCGVGPWGGRPALAASLLLLLLLLPLLQGSLAEQNEVDFDFTDSEVVKRSLRTETMGDDEDLQADDPGSGDVEGSATTPYFTPFVTTRESPVFVRPTTAPTRPVVPGYPVYFQVTLNLTALRYTPALGQRDSFEFRDLATRLKNFIEALFRDVPGDQRVNILQFSPGSVLATFDLGSTGFTDEETLRTVLENAILTGFIGPYQVAPVGFTFEPRDRQVTCPRYVGREPDPLPRNGTNWANLMVNNAFPCPGRIIAWEYYRLIPVGEAYAGVWRQTDASEFELRGSTLLPSASVGRHIVEVPYPINVVDGDFVGIYYPRNTPNNVIASATLADDTVPAMELYQNYYVQMYSDMIREGIPFDINRVPYSVTNATFSVRALMEYAGIGPTLPPRLTCSPDDFRCVDGSCIPGDYYCDGQPDCPDESDEQDCATVCDVDEFRCVSSGQCIPVARRCNLQRDCPDGSDERNCPTGRVTNVRLDRLDSRAVVLSWDVVPDGAAQFEVVYYPNDQPESRASVFTSSPSYTLTQFRPRTQYIVQIRARGEEGWGEFSPPFAFTTQAEVVEPPACTADEFRCIDGSCISTLQRCDSRADCPDGEDEFQCPRRECLSETEFQCGDGTCISITRLCDGRPDCEDLSDELPSVCVPILPGTCPEGQFRCDDGDCINPLLACNGFPDCRDASDEINCGGCADGDFTCDNEECVDSRLRCDGIPDCSDASDETGCPSRECTGSEYRCASGQCIDARGRCNQVPECEDESDERNCPCRPSEFTCSNGQCVPALGRCDRRYDCQDGSDEQNCPCRSDEFQCGDGQCIPSSRRCDRRPDCRDGSDEEACLYCSEREFQCLDGSCIDRRQKCDRFADCPDGSDEFDCACNSAEFRCDNGQCVRGQDYCNGVPDCLDGSDETKCPTPPPARCQPNEFRCGDGTCIDARRRCDRRVDCRDRSDEANCPTEPPPCQVTEFRCGDGRCIDARRRCDRRVDCADRSDEANCPTEPPPCQDNEFRCGDGSCIDTRRRCDGRPDCRDRSDEANCPTEPPPCQDNEFRCGDGSCIDTGRRCDGRPDCRDRSDEANCPCRVDEFTCVSDGRCLPSYARCNRQADCADASDEADCACRADQFRCDSGQCVSSSGRCNGRYDCTDGSDERNCAAPVVVSATPPYMAIREGREATFYCDATGTPPPPVRWSKGGQPLPATAQDIDGILRLSFVTLDDAGNYTCTALSNLGQFQATVRLQVDRVGPPVGPGTGPGNCLREEATCSNGQCIPRDYLCDGEQDCSDGSDETNCNVPLPCEPNEFRCANGRCALKIWRCDGDNDCGDGSDETNCPTREPGAPCRADEYQCMTGDQCIPMSYQCDGEIDCQDRSDEIGCAPPTIVTPPVPNLEVEIGGSFTIICEAVGVPTPLITWRLNWGNIPRGERVTVTSENGRGTLTIRNVVMEDSGAYTCEALNNKGSIFAVPDAIIIVRHSKGVCQPPRFNFGARIQDECVRCFCFGHTQTCYSSNLQISQVTMGNQIQLVQRANLLPVEAGFIQYLPTQRQWLVRDFNRAFPPGTYYWSLPSQFLGNQLGSYGGELKYQILYEIAAGLPFPTSDIDVILSGNGLTLYHRRDPILPSFATSVIVPLRENAWEASEDMRRGDTPISQYASREDLMMVLENVTSILIRATYDNAQTAVRIGDISMTTAVTQETGLGRATLVEDCACPTGYSGLSCQECAPGFHRVRRGRYLGECVPCNCNGHSNDCDPITGQCFNCQHNTMGPYCDQCADGFIGDARQGTQFDCEACPCPLTVPTNQFSRTCVRERDGQITCTACPPGYVGRRCERCADGYQGNPMVPGDSCRRGDGGNCDPRGSLSSRPDPVTGICQCKENVMGVQCDQCRLETFFLAPDYPYGCIPCFCMGVTEMCQSTSYYRSQVGLSFTSDRQGVTLSDMMQNEVVDQGFRVNPSTRELTFRAFNTLPQKTMYWRLPQQFLGDKVTAYGGNLRFTLRYRPGRDSTPLDINEPLVELSGNDITFVYRSDRSFPPSTPESFTIPLFEQYWSRVDGEAVTREYLLMALADLDSLLIRATYTREMDEAALSDVTLDIATDRITGQDRALAVEQCNCPRGYKGLSCEDCADGYTRSGGGLYLGLCVPCQCNGHSSECDPETGVCSNCRHNTEGERCERCIPGYYGDASRGSPNDCQPCPCPLTEAPNQFSPTCILDRDGQVTCTACPAGHTGRRCEICLPGYQGNPLQRGDYCKREVDCNCDPRGTVPNTLCDPVSKTCQCKAYVEGPRCSSCSSGYFHLSEVNAQGCLQCFCMGITDQCSSSNYYRDTVRPTFGADGSHNFVLTNRRLSQDIADGFTVDAARGAITFNSFSGIQRERESLFFKLPPKFRGDMVTSYGGTLRFTLQYSVAYDAGQLYMDVDLEVVSGNRRMYLLLNNPKATPEESHTYEIPLVESSFRSIDGSTPTRQTFMTMLASIDAILIRATHHTIMASATLRDLSMEIAVPTPTGQRPAPEVESCRCPDGYTGLSCQECAPGYLRTQESGSSLGRCVRCNCNSHASSCDPISGRCLNCEHNTEGERCERCRAGFYGDPTVGTPNDCRPCPCPLDIPGNSFSPTCFLDTDNIVTCDRCPMGYTGRDCGTCAPGYVGDPRVPGGTCTRDEVDYRPRVIVSPMSVTEPEGSTAMFQCQVSGRGPFNVVWSRLDRRPLPAEARQTPRYQLLIPNLKQSDSGRYTCTATNSYGSSSQFTDLTVTRAEQPIRIRIEGSREVDADVGTTVRLVCIAVSYNTEQAYILSWSRNGRGLPERAVDQSGVLVIPNIQPEDAGSYTCTGSDMTSTDRASAVIRVRSLEQPPFARIEPRYLQLSEGQKVEFECIAEGTPPPRIEWTLANNRPLPSYVEVSNGRLYIRSATKADEAEYYCTATNSAGTSTVRTIVYVQASEPVVIDVRETQKTVVVGQVIRLECYSRNNGDVLLVWSRQGSLPPGSSVDGGILTIPDAQMSYAGTYTCTGTTPGGRSGQARVVVNVEPDVQYVAPTTAVEPEKVVLTQGQTGTLRCIVSGVPRPQITWSRSRGPLSANHQVNGEVLRIIQATMEDRDIYMCVAENVAGKAMTSVMVDVERREMPMVELYPAEQQTITRGGSALFQCRVTAGIPAPTIMWTRQSGEPFTSTTDVMDENGVIMFKGATGDEMGTYTCTATNAVGSATATATLRVEGPPRITITPGRQVVSVVGEPVTLECTAVGEPTPNVFWQSETRRRSDILPAAYEPEPGSALLIFDQIQKVDGGRYICIATNDRGRTEETVEIIVREGTAILPSDSYVLIQGPERMTVSEGERVELTCAAQGLVSPVVRWRRPGGRPLPPGHSVQGGVLTIPRITQDYAGEYICAVESQRQEYTASVVIIVQVTPRLTITPARVTARPGDVVYLRCRGDGAGPFQYEWQKVGGRLSPLAIERDGTLEIRQITAADAGQYRCLATNPAGTSDGYADVEIMVPPQAVVPQKESLLQNGQLAELRCDVTGNPPPQVSWTKDMGTLPRQHRILNGVLTIYNVAPEDEGRYTCTARNEAGSASDFTYVRVTAPPDVTQQIGRGVQTVDVGDRVEFECIVTGTPTPTVTWLKLEGPLPATAVYGEGTLVIPEVRPEDAGTYRCTATNVAGSVQSQVQLFVRAQPVISLPSDLNTAPLGGPTTLSCDAQGYPQPVMTWTKQDGDLPREHSVVDGDLYIPRVRTEDDGVYNCQASNRYGTTIMPVRLVVGALVPYFPQNPTSYMTYRPLNDVYLDLDILLSFRPETTDGLLLYNGQMDGSARTGGDFVCFGLRGSYPEFTYDMGAGPAIIRGSRPLDLNQWHTVQLKRDRRNGTLIVNDQPYFGVSPGEFAGLDLTENMYLGGLPSYAVLPRSAQYSSGFVGAVSQMKLKGVPVNLGAEAVEVYGVEPYQVCQDRPCLNGGRCIPANNEYGFDCECRPGYAGFRCDVTGERCFPGACGEKGRCYDLPGLTGYRCTCPIGLTGGDCRIPTTIVDPNFNETSFISYPTIDDGLLELTIKLMFKPQSLDDGVILYNAQSTESRSDFVALLMKDGYLEFRYDLGDGVAVLRSRTRLALREWTMVMAERKGRDGLLIVNNDDPVNDQLDTNYFYNRKDRGDIFDRGSSTGNTVGLNLKRPLFLGGVDPLEPITPNLEVRQSFKGCIAEVYINDREIDLVKDAVDSADITDCGDRKLCDRKPCKNGGDCTPLSITEYICNCPPGFTGRNCELEMNICVTEAPCRNGARCEAQGDGYRCHCPIGFIGRNCEQSIAVGTSFEVSGDGFVELNRTYFPHRRRVTGDRVSFTIKTTGSDGLLFWQGQEEGSLLGGADYLAIGLKDGFVEFRYELGSGAAVIASQQPVNDGFPHLIQVHRLGRKGNLTVDSYPPIIGSSVGPLQVLNVPGNIYVGGLPELREMTADLYRENFSGCIEDLRVQEEGPIDVSRDSIGGFNVRPCLN